MDLNLTLLWAVLVNCGAFVLQSVRARRWTGWAAVSLFVLAITGAGYWYFPTQAGYVAIVPWLVLIFVPLVGHGLVNWMLRRHWYRLGWLLAQVVAWVHPWDNFWNQPHLVQVMARLYHGDAIGAQELLSRFQDSRSELAMFAQVLAARLQGNWNEVLNWMRGLPEGLLTRDPMLMDALIQALGETQRHTELLETYARLVVPNPRFQQGIQVHLMRLRFASYLGEREIVERLISGPLSLANSATKAFWRATVMQTAGQSAEAAPLLEKLTTQKDQQIAARAQQRLTSPLQPFDLGQAPLEHQQILADLADAVGHESHFAVMTSASPRPAPVTWLLVLSLLLVFLIEIPGGATDNDNLVKLGALVVPMEITPGEYHRFVTAAFLHSGVLHLMMNIFGLQWFGQRLERAWGSLPMLICYLLTAIGSMALFPLVIQYCTNIDPWERPFVLVGASGGVMGLIGAIVGHLAVGALCGKTPQVSTELGVLASIVGLQTFLDAQSPQVSVSVHLTGVCLGFLMGLTYAWLTRHRSKITSRTVPTVPVANSLVSEA